MTESSATCGFEWYGPALRYTCTLTQGHDGPHYDLVAERED